MILSMRIAARIILLIADGNFASEALLVTLADTPSNALFADSILMKLAEARNPALVQKLFEEEVPDNGEEE